jgi:hypothetical protein
MRSRFGGKLVVLTAVLAAALAVTLGGCGGPEEVLIEPLPAGPGGTNLGLGPGVRPLSSGPGDKGAPRWGADDSRIAYVVDGYVVDKPLYARDLRRWTTRDFGAEEIEWSGDDRLTVLGYDGPAEAGMDHAHEENPAAHTVYRTLPPAGSLGVESVANRAYTMGAGPGGEGLIVALEAGYFGSNLVLVGEDGRVERAYTDPVGGRVTGLSVSPDGDRAVLAVQGTATFALYLFDLSDGGSRTLTRLAPGTKVFGAPQWTRYGIYYVAGKEEAATEEDGAPPYNLYRVAPGSDAPKPVSGAGEGFVAASLSASPDGRRLAVIGRRNPNSPTNVYVLDLPAGEPQAATANENMEIKTGPEDLSWSASGESLAVVARGALSEPRVRSAPADALVTDFYNLYEVPVEPPEAGGAEAEGSEAGG